MERSRQTLWLNILLSLAIGIVTIKELDALITPGIDQPFRWALNWLLANDRHTLADLSYAVGPLCLLKYPAPVGDHIIISALFNLLLNAIFVYLFVSFYCKRHETYDIALPAVLAMVYILLAEPDYLFIGIATVAALDYYYHKRTWQLWLTLCFTIAGVYIKTSLFMHLLSIWLVFGSYLIYKRKIGLALLLLISASSIFFLGGYLLFTDMNGAFRYAIHSFELASGYSGTHSRYPVNDWILLSVSLLALLVLYIVYLRRAAGFLLSLLTLSLFFTWKYAMGREDFWHAIAFLYILASLLLLFIAVQKEKRAAGLLLFLIAISAYTANLKNLENYTNNVFWLPDLKNFNDRVLHHNKTKQKLLADSKAACAVKILPDSQRKKIGNASTDVFPFDLSYAMINELRFTPRPALQSGSGLYNDRIDARHYASNDAPQYIIWHTFGDRSKVDALDGLYLPNTNPLTIEAIQRFYIPTADTGAHYVIWQKRAKPLVKKDSIIKMEFIRWNNEIPVPVIDSGSKVMLKLKIGYTTKYKLLSLLYKGLPLFIEYHTDSAVYKYRFTEDIATSGILAAPLLKDIKGTTEKVRSIRITNEDADYYTDEVQLEWHKVSYR